MSIFLGGKATAEKWSIARQAAMSGDLSVVDDQLFVQHYSSLCRIAKDFQPRPPDLETFEPIGFWYYGKTGVGKTYSALREFPDAYRKISNNKWWDGYQGETNVIIDDLDKSHAYMGYHLKIWGDKNTFIAETKGSSKYIRPTKVCVTSNYHPRDIWGTEEGTLGPILRRFKVVHFKSFMDCENTREDEEVRCAYAPGFVPPPVNLSISEF